MSNGYSQKQETIPHISQKFVCRMSSTAGQVIPCKGNLLITTTYLRISSSDPLKVHKLRNILLVKFCFLMLKNRIVLKIKSNRPIELGSRNQCLVQSKRTKKKKKKIDTSTKLERNSNRNYYIFLVKRSF